MSAEFAILKSSHKFLRPDAPHSALSWEDAVADKFEQSLFREYALCDLKHYKSGNFALRWRVDHEVLSGAGQDTCGNTRCAYHRPGSDRQRPSLATLELPFQYLEHGAVLTALVKVVLCDRCHRKLMWRRNKDKEARNDVDFSQRHAVDSSRTLDKRVARSGDQRSRSASPKPRLHFMRQLRSTRSRGRPCVVADDPPTQHRQRPESESIC